jgi:hypothetical protein
VEPTVSIFRVEVKMEAVGSSDALVSKSNITWHNNPNQYLNLNLCSSLEQETAFKTIKTLGKITVLNILIFRM